MDKFYPGMYVVGSTELKGVCMQAPEDGLQSI